LKAIKLIIRMIVESIHNPQMDDVSFGVIGFPWHK